MKVQKMSETCGFQVCLGFQLLIGHSCTAGLFSETGMCSSFKDLSGEESTALVKEAPEGMWVLSDTPACPVAVGIRQAMDVCALYTQFSVYVIAENLF